MQRVKLFVSLCLLLMGLNAVGVLQAQSLYKEGVNYQRIDPIQPTPSDQIEVIEVYSYACVHCNHFQPLVTQWAQTKPADVKLTYLPAAFQPTFAVYAAAFYAAEQLGIAEQSHQAVYDALWKDNKRFSSMDEIALFYSQFGVTKEAFLKAVDSGETKDKLAKGQEMIKKYGIEGTPSLIVAGKYRIDGRSAGGQDKMLSVANFLITEERANRKRVLPKDKQ